MFDTNAIWPPWRYRRIKKPSLTWKSDRRTCVLGENGVGLVEIKRKTLSHIRELCDEIDGIAVDSLITTAEAISKSYKLDEAHVNEMRLY